MKRAALAFTALALACSVRSPEGEVGVYEAPAAEPADTPDGPEEAPPEGAGGSASEPPVPDPPLIFLTVTLRDFKRYAEDDPTTNPAFNTGNSEMSVVAPTLGDDSKPVYQTHDSSFPMFGDALFQQWFHDVPGTNHAVAYPLPVTLAADGTFEYDSQKSGTAELYMGKERRVFFPLDDGTAYATPFGNQGDSHNKLFTAELHATFTLAATGSTFQARGDDDVYVFIDRRLAIDLGGVHGVKIGKVALDDLGLVVGQSYDLDLFYAERFGGTGDLGIKTDLQLASRLD